MLLKPALTDILCITCINSIQCSKLKKRTWCSQSTSALTWTMCVCEGKIVQNYGATVVAPTQDTPTPPLVEDSVFPSISYQWSWYEQNFGHVSRWCLLSKQYLGIFQLGGTGI
jgi:hypothetical protein